MGNPRLKAGIQTGVMRKLLLCVPLAGLLLAQQPARQDPAKPDTTRPDASKQEAPPAGSQDSDQGPVFGITRKEVQAPVTVLDHDGNFVNGLTPLNFRLLDNGKPQQTTLDLE